VTSTPGYWPNTWRGSYDNLITMVYLGGDDRAAQIREYVNRHKSTVVFGRIQSERRFFNNGNPYNWCQVTELTHIDIWRDYWREVNSLEANKATLQINNWERQFPAHILEHRRREAETLTRRATSLRNATTQTIEDSETATNILVKSFALEKKSAGLGIFPDLRFVPTMVFLQSAHYAGALSAYRQLMSMTGIDDSALEGLLSLEHVGLCDWPTVYERWCLVSLLRVLQDDFRFVFGKKDVSRALLQHCTGQKQAEFDARARRDDMCLELVLRYQPRLANGKTPDFLLELTDTKNNHVVRCILDAKSCSFQHRPPDAPLNPWRYLDDSLSELVNRKDYGEGGRNHVFVMHSVKTCRCAECNVAEEGKGPVTQPTTLQSWASASAYGGDSVFSWETERPEHRHGAVMVRPEASLSDLRRLILQIIQFGLDRNDICASCGAGGDDIVEEPGHGVGVHHKCTKCDFLSVRSHCYNCRQRIVKNQAWWTYHDLHPTDVWNVKCWACGSLL